MGVVEEVKIKENGQVGVGEDKRKGRGNVEKDRRGRLMGKGDGYRVNGKGVEWEEKGQKGKGRLNRKEKYCLALS